jgi:hypothetical protein
MKTITLTLALASLFACAAFAAEPGDMDPKNVYLKPTPQEKAAARLARKAAGAKAGKEYFPDPGVPIPAPQVKVSRAEKNRERAPLKAETTRANRAGEITPVGEVGPR